DLLVVVRVQAVQRHGPIQRLRRQVPDRGALRGGEAGGPEGRLREGHHGGRRDLPGEAGDEPAVDGHRGTSGELLEGDRAHQRGEGAILRAPEGGRPERLYQRAERGVALGHEGRSRGQVLGSYASSAIKRAKSSRSMRRSSSPYSRSGRSGSRSRVATC